MTTATSARVHIQFILDKSGSMELIKSDTIGGFNAYLADRQREADIGYRFSLTLFDTAVSRPFTDCSIALVPPLSERSYIPSGNTALFDAVASGITAIEGRVDAGDKVLVVILTDGQENSSRETTLAQVKAAIAAKQAQGWQFAFLSTDMGAWQGQAMGVPVASSAAFTPSGAGMAANMRQASLSTANYARSRTPNYVTPNVIPEKEPV